MKVILQADVSGQGKKGEVVNVSDGYARNYLLPRKLAVEASTDALNAIKNRDQALLRKKEAEKARAQALAAQLSAMPVRISKKAGTGGRLFGAVTAKEVSDALQAQHGAAVDHRKIELPEPIKAFGTYELKVKLFPEIAATLYVTVTE